MAHRAEPHRDVARRIDLDPVALVVVDRQRVEPEAPFARQSRDHHRIEPAREQHDRVARKIGRVAREQHDRVARKIGRVAHRFGWGWRDHAKGLTGPGTSGNAASGNFQELVQLPTRRASAITSNGSLLAMPELSIWTSRGDSKRNRVRPLPWPVQV